MRKPFVVVALLLCLSAWAGERLLGVLLVTDAGIVSNQSTGYGSAGCNSAFSPGGAGACAQSFPIGVNTLLSVQCRDQGAIFKANWYAVDAGDGIRLAADQFFTTSTGTKAVIIPLLPDGGSYVGGVVSITPLAGAARAECAIYDRNGGE